MSSKSTILGGGITVDLDAITRNWKALDTVAANALTGAVLKADAYGMGAAAVGQTLFMAGARFFFVATPDEGVALRAARGIPRAAATAAVHGMACPERPVLPGCEV